MEEIMSKSPSTTASGALKTKNLSPDQKRLAITKLVRRINDLENLDINSLRKSKEPAVIALQAKIESTLEEIFDHQSTQYHRYKKAMILDLTNYLVQLNRDFPITVLEIQQGHRDGVARAIALLQQICDYLNESLDDLSEAETDRTLRAYEGLDLHTEIARAAGTLYRSGHYSNAIEDAVKALNALVRLRSDQNSDGTSLMETVFSARNPILKFNDLQDESDRNEQKGFMMLFSGAVAGLRNPRAHKLIKDDAERALEFIAFISLLAKLLDSAERVF